MPIGTKETKHGKEFALLAIYHCSIKIISRGKGKSAVAATAYRSGEIITNSYDGLTHDYTRKGGIVHTEILLPENAPREYADRSTLWNAVEKSERYKTAQLAREIEIALPAELTREQNISLAREYVKRNFVKQGMCADICIHDKGDGNPQTHIMLTMRPIEKDGTWGQKSRTENGKKIPTVDWNEQTKAEEWRAAWSDICNQFLERNNADERIDHRSFERQGIEQKPNKRDAYYENHRAEITLYEAAERYLKPVMNGRTTIPTYSWKEELKNLTAEKSNLYQEYYRLKDEVRDVEIIKRTVEQLISSDAPGKKIKRAHEAEL